MALLDLYAALTALAVCVFTPAHVAAVVSIRNDRRLGMLRDAAEAFHERNAAAQRERHASRGRSVSRSVSRSSSRSRSPSANRALAVLGESLAALYLRRTGGLLLATGPAMLLDMLQCLPLLSAYFYDGGCGVSRGLFLGLLVAFGAPRLGLLALHGVARRVVFDAEHGAFAEAFEYRPLYLWLRPCATGAEREVREAEAQASDPLWHLRPGPAGIVTGKCLIALRRTVGLGLVACFPTTPALFLILDNVAKNAAAGGTLGSPRVDRRAASPPASSSGSAAASSRTASTAMPMARMASPDLVSSSGGGGGCGVCSGCCSAWGAADGPVAVVAVGAEDERNARIFATYLLVAFGSQLALCWSFGFPFASKWGVFTDDNGDGGGGGGSGGVDDHGEDDKELTVSRLALVGMVLFEFVTAALLALIATCGLANQVWPRVRVVFVNRASLWLSPVARDRDVPRPNRVLAPGIQPSSRHAPQVPRDLASTAV